MLYKPLANFKLMAHIYAGLEKGDGLPVYEAFTVGRGGRVGGYEASLLDGSRMVQQLEKKKKEKESNMDTWSTKTPASEPYEIPFEPDVPHAVHCTDAQPLNESPEELLEYAQMLSNVSKWAGAANLPFRSGCTGRKVRSKWQMPGGKRIAVPLSKTLQPWMMLTYLGSRHHPWENGLSDSVYWKHSRQCHSSSQRLQQLKGVPRLCGACPKLVWGMLNEMRYSKKPASSSSLYPPLVIGYS